MCIATGFYTPNYAGIASEFSRNLDAHNTPYKLYPVEILSGTWIAQTLRKPQIVLQAMADQSRQIRNPDGRRLHGCMAVSRLCLMAPAMFRKSNLPGRSFLWKPASA